MDNKMTQNSLRPAPLTLIKKLAITNVYDLLMKNQFAPQDNIQRLATMFNCLTSQFQYALPQHPGLLKKRKEKLLQRYGQLRRIEDCVYEYSQRVQYHRRESITENCIKAKAMEFCNIMNIRSFRPTTNWFLQFKMNYNISLTWKEIGLTRKPPTSLNLKCIVKYCNKKFSRSSNELNTDKTEIMKSRLYFSPFDELRWSKIGLELLELALKEYIKRVTVHHKCIELDDTVLKQVALELNAILKLSNFELSLNWLQDVKKTQITEEIPPISEIPLSLNLMDILSICCNRVTINSPIANLPTETKKYINNRYVKKEYTKKKYILHMDVEDKEKAKVGLKEFQKCSKNLYLATDVVRSKPKNPQLMKPVLETTKSPLKKRKVFGKTIRTEKTTKKKLRNIKTKVIPNLTQQENVAELQTSVSSSTYQLNSLQLPLKNAVELPFNVNSHKDALCLLKPLEDYAMLTENYRAIGLLQQLENLLQKNSHEPNFEKSKS